MQDAEFRELIARSRDLADTGDLLGVALGSGDPTRVDDAVDDLLAAYDQFRARAAREESRLGFDELAATLRSVARDQLVAEGLAAALMDLEAARILAGAADATGELRVEGGRADLDEAVQSALETVTALEARARPGSTSFAFDEIVTPPAGGTGNPDLPTAKAAFDRGAQAVYDLLSNETATLFGNSVTAVIGLDAGEISNSISAVTEPLRVSGAGRIAARVVESFKWAIDRLKELLGSDALRSVDEELSHQFDELRQGAGATRQILNGLYGRDTGLMMIGDWLKKTSSDSKTIDGGCGDLTDLHLRAAQFFAVLKRIGRILSALARPVKFILQKIGGTLPVDLIVGGAHCLVMIVALACGMDYADTATFFKIDGVLTISRRALGVAS